MISTWKRCGWVVAVGAAMVISAGAEDLTIVSQVTAGKHSTTSTQYITGDKVRTSDGNNDTIMEYSTGRMTMIDHKKKEYYETSLAEMSAMFDNLNKQMEGNPILGKLLGEMSDVTVQKGGSPRTIAGYRCEQYLLNMGDALSFDIWAAPDLQTPIQYYDASKLRYAAMGPMGQRFEKMYDEMKKVQGLPLAMGINIKMMGMKTDTLSEATEVRKGPIPASAFEIPAGYKKKNSPFKGK
ncbi:MAG TPA: DUF4412 domain-containing protein [Acidobacteriota bacterium]